FGALGNQFDSGTLFVITGIDFDSLYAFSESGDRMGVGVSRGYDFDADGYGDIIAAARNGTDMFGQPDARVTGFNGGPTNAEFPRESERFLFTGAASIDIPVAAGDVNADGRVDIVA